MTTSIKRNPLISRPVVSRAMLLGIFSFVLLTGYGARGEAAEESKMEVGVIVPLTGGWSEWGASLRKSIDFAANHLAMTDRFVFRYEDEGECDARKAVDSYRALRARYGSRIFIVGCMNGARAIKPIAKREGALLLSAGFQEDDVFENEGPVINYALQMNDEAELLARKVRDLGIRRFGLVRDAGTDAFVETMRKSFAIEGTTTVSLDAVVESPDFELRSIITALKSRKIEGLFINTSPQNVHRILRALNEQQLSIPVFSSYGFRDIMEHNQFLQSFPFTVSYTFPKLSVGAADFEHAFAKKFSELPRVNGLFVFDMLEQLKISAAPCREVETASCVRSALASGRDIEGLSGRFRVRPDGSILREFEIVRAEWGPTKEHQHRWAMH